MIGKTYAIGDVHGCLDELQDLLAVIEFRPKLDQLWFTGDLVNRGPKSLETLRFIKDLPNTHIVLGNHDVHLLAIASKCHPLRKEDSMQAILKAPDHEELLNWLRKQALLHYDASLGYVITHAGIFPEWTLDEAITYATELEAVLQADDYQLAIPELYGNEPSQWSSSLVGWDRLRFILNAFTRMRFCDTESRILFHWSGTPDSAPSGYLPWYEVPNRQIQTPDIIFGHWSALEGHTSVPNVHALDTGCVWGRALTAMRLEDGLRFSARARHTPQSLY